MPIKISVVIPTYRRPLLLKKCLAALINQNFDPGSYEIIVVSDGYDQITEEVVKKTAHLHPYLRYLHLPEKKGPAAARNFGWQHAAGSLIAFTDDDTLPDRNWISAFYSVYKQELEIAFTGKVKVPISSTPTDYEKNTAGLETAEFVTANCCCSKAALMKTGGFDERFSMAWREDSDLEFKLLLGKIPIVHVPDAIIVHPVRKAFWGVSLKEQKKGMYNALLYKKFPRLYRKKIQPAPPWNYYIINLSILLLLVGVLTQTKWLALAASVSWLVLVCSFIVKRLKDTSRSFQHVAEMVFTSMVIPFLSVYWQIYGAVKYRVLFL